MVSVIEFQISLQPGPVAVAVAELTLLVKQPGRGWFQRAEFLPELLGFFRLVEQIFKVPRRLVKHIREFRKPGSLGHNPFRGFYIIVACALGPQNPAHGKQRGQGIRLEADDVRERPHCQFALAQAEFPGKGLAPRIEHLVGRRVDQFFHGQKHFPAAFKIAQADQDLLQAPQQRELAGSYLQRLPISVRGILQILGRRKAGPRLFL